MSLPDEEVRAWIRANVGKQVRWVGCGRHRPHYDFTIVGPRRGMHAFWVSAAEQYPEDWISSTVESVVRTVEHGTTVDPDRYYYWFTYSSYNSFTSLVPAGPDRSRYPHTCPRCGSAAYIGAVPSAVDCTGETCPTRRR